MTIDTSVVALPVDIFCKTFARSAGSGMNAEANGNSFKATGGILKDVNRLPDIFNDMKSVWYDVQNLNDRIPSSLEGLTSGSSDVSEWTFFKNTFLDKKISQTSFLRTLDKTMLSTKTGTQIVEALGGKVVEKKVLNKAGETVIAKSIEGSASAQVAGNTLAKISGLNLIFASVLEVPDLVKSAQNGDFVKQVGRSSLNVAAGWGSTAFFSSLFKKIAPQKFKSVAGLIGGAIGAVVSGFVTTKVNDAIFGKSIAAQKREQKQLQEKIQEKTAAQNVIDKVLSQQIEDTPTTTFLA